MPTQIELQMQEMHRFVTQLNMRAHRTSQRLAALEAAAMLRSMNREPCMPIDFRAQFAEDALVWDILGGQADGFFIEVGAFDGYHLSVTYALESIGWRGLLIEAIPERAEECRARRPRSRVVNAALSRPGSAASATFTVTDDRYGGMLSYLHADKEHMAMLDSQRMQRRSVSVPLTTMDELLKEHSGPIDLASIDVEGGELAVLEGFNLHKHKPRVLLLEDNSYGRQPALGKYMEAQPYAFVAWHEMNRVYIRADEQELIRRFTRQ